MWATTEQGISPPVPKFGGGGGGACACVCVCVCTLTAEVVNVGRAYLATCDLNCLQVTAVVVFRSASMWFIFEFCTERELHFLC